MAKPKRPPVRKGARDILEALKQPDLDPSRRTALQFVARVRRFASGKRQASTDTAHPLEFYVAHSVCVCCDRPSARTYCSELCQQEATTVRYLRRVLADLRVNDLDVQAGIGIRLLMLAGGGYPEEARDLAPGLRAQILERDNHICQLCGGVATQIDHIHGSSPEPSNLQSLCGNCNRKKAWGAARVVTAESDPETFTRVQAQYDRLAQRVAVAVPLRLCDDEELWKVAQYPIRSARTKPRLPRA